MFGRLGTFTFWEDDAALDRRLASHPHTGGWSARLEPLRRFGTWPGLPEEVPRTRKVDHDGPALVLTLGRARLPRVFSFLQTSKAAEKAVLDASGVRWASGFAKPPFFATCSIWESDDALMTYAYGDDPGHPGAIDADRAKPFHHESAFVRFRPYDVRGSLEGRNPLPADVLADA
jgi:hypothetical protein